MLNLQTLKIDPFSEHLAARYESTFGTLFPEQVDKILHQRFSQLRGREILRSSFYSFA